MNMHIHAIFSMHTSCKIKNCPDDLLRISIDVISGITFLISDTEVLFNIGLDKGGYSAIIFLISQRKHMLWVLIRRALVRRF